VQAIRYGYTQFAPGTDEKAGLDAIVREGLSRGLVFLTDEDARPEGSASPLAHLWDNGPDAAAGLRQELEVRRIGLAGFGEHNVAPGQPLTLLNEVLVPLYFHHRYQLEAASKVVGGLRYTYALRGDGQPPSKPVDGDAQRRALAAILDVLSPETLDLPEPVIDWIARRVTQNVRELEGAITRITAHTSLTGRPVDVQMAQEALGDLDRQLVAPVPPENVLQSVCNYFGLEHKDLMSGRRQRTISLARSVAMFLVRKTAKLSFPEIGSRMGKRNHSTVISACRRIERAVAKNEQLLWTSSVGERQEEAVELIQRLEEHSRAIS